jgi:DNA polymerase III subunit epsilon
MYLFFDTETTGIPRNYKAPVTDVDNWPRIVQIAWLLADDAGAEISSAEYLVRPAGFRIPAEATRVHGITTEEALERGAELGAVLEGIVAEIQRSAVLVAHNMAFDEKILGAELLRLGRVNELATRKRECTMQSSTNYCRIPGKFGYKWPTLAELHQKLFGEGVSGAHRALADVRACARCYFELKRLGIIG